LQIEAEMEFAGVTVGLEALLVNGDDGTAALEWLSSVPPRPIAWRYRAPARRR